MVLEAQARPSFTTLFATICAHKARLFFVLPPLALQLFSSRVVVLHIPTSRSLFPAMRPHSATSPKTLNLQNEASWQGTDRKSTRLNSSHQIISYAVFFFKKKKKII